MFDYPITRSFRWRWFTPITMLFALIALVFLVLLNIPLTGYETITSFQSDFNATTPQWYNRFMPFLIPKPGSTCAPSILNIGDAFTGNYSFFQWQIDSVMQATAGDSSIAYKGIPLTSCDVTSIYLDGNLLSWNVDFTVIVTCADPSLNITARTDFSMSQLPGRYSPLLGLIRWDNSDGTTNSQGVVLDGIIQAATTDLGTRAYNAFLGSNFTCPTITSLQAHFEPCPMSVGETGWATIPPVFVIQYATTACTNATTYNYDYTIQQPQALHDVLGSDIAEPIANVLQSVYAAIRIDLGNPSTNNFILNPSSMKNTIVPFFVSTPFNPHNFSRISTLYEQWANPNAMLQQLLPITVAGPAHIQAVYLCRAQRQKRTGSLFISVLVATLSMFSSGWAVFMIIATMLAKREHPIANRCDAHRNHHGRQMTDDDTLLPSLTESISLRSLKDHVYEPVNPA